MEDAYNDHVYEMFHLYIHMTYSTETVLISIVYM